MKLIAEPWDVGEGGYQVGQLPAAVVGVERQVPRRACATSGAATTRPLAEFGYRFTGSSDLYESTGRTPVGQHQLHHRPRRLHARAISSPTTTSTTRPTARTTATATDDNRSWNCGVEGPTDDAEVAALRGASSATSWRRCCSRRACRCSLGGDEIGRTQHGNNNAYCQDNEISWYDWEQRRRATCSSSRGGLMPAAPRSSRSSGAAAGSRGARSAARRPTTSAGSRPTARA